MKRLLFVLVALASLGIGCASIRGHYHNPDGSLNVKAVLTDAGYGLTAGCDSGWVSPADCALGADALNVAGNIAAQNGPGIILAVRQSLVTFEARLTPDNHIRPYLDWVIALLPST